MVQASTEFMGGCGQVEAGRVGTQLDLMRTKRSAFPVDEAPVNEVCAVRTKLLGMQLDLMRTACELWRRRLKGGHTVQFGCGSIVLIVQLHGRAVRM